MKTKQDGDNYLSTAGLRANFTLHAIALEYANSLAEMDFFIIVKHQI